jgi:hypothetical protein
MVQTKECVHVFYHDFLLQTFFAGSPNHGKCPTCFRQLVRRLPPEPPAKCSRREEGDGDGEGEAVGDGTMYGYGIESRPLLGKLSRMMMMLAHACDGQPY